MERLNNVMALFKNYKDKEFLFVQPGGNWGDHFIYFEAEFLAQSLGLSFTFYTKTQFLALEDVSDNVIYIHGGGAFNEWCSDSGFALLSRALKFDNNIVIYGPASCSDNIDFLQQKFTTCFAENQSLKCYMFAREQKIYEIFANLNILNEHTTLSKDVDTAFHLTKEAIIDRVGDERNSYDFYGFREDNEAPDISHEMSFKEVVFDPALWSDDFEHWLKIHLHAKKIITNRTHSSILGSILQKPTYLFSGSYHKNKSIWEEVLHDKGVKWLEPEVAINSVKSNFIDKFLPNVFKNSWKVKHAYWKWKKVPSLICLLKIKLLSLLRQRPKIKERCN